MLFRFSVRILVIRKFPGKVTEKFSDSVMLVGQGTCALNRLTAVEVENPMNYGPCAACLPAFPKPRSWSVKTRLSTD